MNSFQDADPNAPSCGTLHLIKEASRPSSWVLNSGTATSFTDVDFSACVPVGVMALYLKYSVVWTGNGSADRAAWELRENGSTATDSDQLIRVGEYYTDLTSGTERQVYGFVTCGCDSSGIIEYRFYQGGTAVGSLYLNIAGYYI